MFLAEFLDTFGISLSDGACLALRGDRIAQLERNLRSCEQQLIRLRSKLVRCRRRIEMLQIDPLRPRFHRFKSLSGKRADRIQRLESLYSGLVAKTLASNQRLALLRQRLSRLAKKHRSIAMLPSDE